MIAVACVPACCANHDPDDECRVCRTVAGTAMANVLPPYPEPVAITVGSLRAVGPAQSAELDESWRVTLTRGYMDADVLEPAAARTLGLALLQAADEIERGRS